MLQGFKDLSYPDRFRKIGLPMLAYRKQRSDAVETNKSGEVAAPDLRIETQLPEVTKIKYRNIDIRRGYGSTISRRE